MVYAHWPTGSVWILGFFFGVSLLFHGFALLMPVSRVPVWSDENGVMKLRLYAICCLGNLIGIFGCATRSEQPVFNAAPSAPAVVRIDFVDPGRFTDFRINGRDFQHSSPVFTRDVTSALRPVMARRFPGHTLNLRYTDIDLAGRHTSGPQGLRVVPTRGGRPWLVFNYVLQNPSGRTIASGSRRLVVSAPASSTESRTRPVQIESFKSISQSPCVGYLCAE